MFIYMISFVIIAFAAMVQGITSFGFSLVSLPLLALILPLETIVPMLVVFSLFLNIIVFTKVKGHVNKKQIVILIVFGLISIPLGIYGLQSVDESMIKMIAGIIIVISSIAMNFGLKIKFKNQTLAYGLTGLLSGVLNGASSLSGPPVILLLSNEGVNKDNFRKTLSTYFTVLNLFTVPIFIASGVLTADVAMDTVKLFPAMVIGTLLGIGIGNRLHERFFTKMTLILIFIMGVMTLVSA